MGRHKKNDSGVLVGIVNDFYTDAAGGNPEKLKYSALARFAQARGIQADWYDFRRDSAVLRRIQELREQSSMENDAAIVPAYKSLDIEELLRSSRTSEELKRKLYELDCYWKKIYEHAARVTTQNFEMSLEKDAYDEKIRRLESEKEQLALSAASSSAQIKRLREETAYLRKALREYLYPSVANKLLREYNLPAEGSGSVRPEAFVRLIEGSTPQPFNGFQQPVSKAPDRCVQLLDAMRKQVRGDE